jgi:hypothetical protein
VNVNDLLFSKRLLPVGYTHVGMNYIQFNGKGKRKELAIQLPLNEFYFFCLKNPKYWNVN